MLPAFYSDMYTSYIAVNTCRYRKGRGEICCDVTIELLYRQCKYQQVTRIHLMYNE
jgi:hypothetical protein